jgi:mono/diheme cytochrome c family protein
VFMMTYPHKSLVRLPALVFALALALAALPAAAAEPASQGAAPETPAARGYRWLTEKAYLPPDFDQELFDNLWQVWPAELRDRAAAASLAERRKLAFARYGLVERPGTTDPAGPALGYVATAHGGWAMNCLACHTGQFEGRVIPGLPNVRYALETLTDEVRMLKLRMNKPLTHMDLGGLKMPLGTTRGTTNSVMFGVALGALRDLDLNVRRDLSVPRMMHHDMDAPAFWNVKRKKRLYGDGFAAKGHRPLIQFVMLPRNSGETLRGWESDYRDILAWIESLEPPAYPGAIDRELADQGAVAFERVCARCHGSYGTAPHYPERIVPLSEVQTDPVRVESLSVEYRRAMRDGWFGEYGKHEYVLDPQGYVAPPLDGVWATAPYLHNGSVPTLWHLLHPRQRPAVWKRHSDDFDRQRLGLSIDAFDKVPSGVTQAAERREYFDTSRPGKSARGHDFPDELTDAEKTAVLEYLKAL